MSLGWRRIWATLLVSYLVSMLIAWIIVNMGSESQVQEPKPLPQEIESTVAPSANIFSGSAQDTGGPDWPAPMGEVDLRSLDDAEREIEFKQEPALVVPEPIPAPSVETVAEVGAKDSVSRPVGDAQRDIPPPVAPIETMKENTALKPARKESEKSEREDPDLFPIETKSLAEKVLIEKALTEKAATKKIDEPLTIANLEKLKTVYESAYNNGDKQALAELFEQDIQSNERRGLEAVLASYQQLFDITMSREIVIEKLDWSFDKGTARGRGDFKVSVRQRGSTFLSEHRGKIELNVNESASKLLIVKIEYNYYK